LPNTKISWLIIISVKTKTHINHYPLVMSK
jgi:hypothetical protein